MRSVRGACATALLMVALAPSCGNNKPQGSGARGSGGVGGDTSGPGSGGAGGTGPLRACIDRPDGLPRPPVNGLPCELIPPGLAP